MPNDFDRIATFYDRLAGLVFGKAIQRSQAYFLRKIMPGSQVLILGGGSGHILDALDQLGIQMQVVYIERSAKMLQLSRGRLLSRRLSVSFIHGTGADIPPRKFDVVITAFFLDVFEEKGLSRVMKTIDGQLKFGGKWLQTDFVNTSSLWQRALVKCMYLFFRVFTNLEGSKLINFSPLFAQLGFEKEASRYFFKNMIVTEVYTKKFRENLELK